MGHFYNKKEKARNPYCLHSIYLESVEIMNHVFLKKIRGLVFSHCEVNFIQFTKFVIGALHCYG